MERQMRATKPPLLKNRQKTSGPLRGSWEFFSRIMWKTHRMLLEEGGEAAPAHSLTAHVHERRGRAPVAEWLAISIFDSLWERTRRSRRPTRRGGLTAVAARATCAHLSPPLHSTRNRMVLQKNGQQRTCRECSRHRPHRPGRGSRGSATPLSAQNTWLTRRNHPSDQINKWHTAHTMERLVLITEVTTHRNSDVEHANSVIDNEHKANSCDALSPAECARSESDCPTNCRSTCKYKQWLWTSEAEFVVFKTSIRFRRNLFTNGFLCYL